MSQSTDKFRIIYDWPAMDDHLMDVQDIGQSLISLWEIIKLANSVNWNVVVSIEVKAKAWFEKWSFWVDIEVLARTAVDVKVLFGWDTATAIANALAICGFSYKIWEYIGNSPIWTSLIWLYKKLKGSKPIDVTYKSNSVIVRYINPDNFESDELEVIPEVFRLYSLLQARQAMQKIIAEPLSKEWVETFKILHKNNEIVITKTEAIYFKDESELKSTEEIIENAEITITSVAFVENQKWRAIYRWKSIFIKLLDKIFIDKINNHSEKFWIDDRIIWKLLQRTIEIPEQNPKIEYELIEVYSHLDWKSNPDQLTVGDLKED